ncbi:potassium channel family protein [Georgenia satyanarayanai]|nr:potassium channel family protein [Georgenia satyanarayanai]
MWIATVAGVVLVLAALWDLFHTLWNPSGQGPICRLFMRLVWRTSKHVHARAGRLSGPVTLVIVILTWVVLVVVGCALIYWPHVPEAFSYSPGLMPEERGNLLDALYLSAVALVTLGLGDIVPTAGWLQLLVPLEALLGFALLTAAVSWVLQVYPALTRRRSLALRLDALRRAGTAEALPHLDRSAASGLLGELADGVGKVYVDLVQYSETYFFRDSGARTTLAVTVPYALELAEVAEASTVEDVRHGGRTLAEVLADLAEVLDDQFLHTGADTAGVLAAYKDDQSLPS